MLLKEKVLIFWLLPEMLVKEAQVALSYSLEQVQHSLEDRCTCEAVLPQTKELEVRVL
jgi:hypothetical protein